ncbi:MULTISPECIES: glycoside hydrolase family 35 protein [unclassified Streptomyces]|uniref:glycoside hydrolase family 35 protein n=1 Tax=unclassified Streptomyces TaxID=2593676 RepID=UPI0006FF826F|nr:MULTISPECIES: glycoside hydrolase family 35 protein [unclassified Streptomyces]KQX56307.1 beta-galactosidase [Streptomyces sp. Root1304]KRA97122.1 beta-galactosidase [Streptomyces sp. Root66D1]
MSRLEIADDGFRLDDRPFRIISGALHYFRVHPDQWADRLRKARLLGLNTVETYVPWNAHAPRRGEFHLDRGLDLPRFLDTAAAEGLHVLLRPGPYICAEWEGGGLPSWLLADEDLVPRSRDPRYLSAVDEYLGALLPPLRPHLGSNGGPILAVQVENEYGAHGDDTAYLAELAAMLRRHGVDVPLFTCDQPSDLARGGLDGVLATANFGSRAAAGLAALRAHQPRGPLMCGEFWIGWFDRWGGVHARRDPADAAAALDELLAAGASVNIYMFHGGTNFGFTNGANDKGTYRPTVTSYDYDALLDEAGDPTPKYAAFREVIARHAPVPAELPPPVAPKTAYGPVELTHTAGLLDQADALGVPEAADRPLTLEELGHPFGFVLHETDLPTPGPALLHAERVHDRAQFFVDGQPVGVLERENHEHALAFTVPRPGARLSVLVENQGRVNYGPAIRDRKGLLGRTTVNGTAPARWHSRALPLHDPDAVVHRPHDPERPPVGPAFHRGTFTVDEPADTFLHLDGWTKGLAWINGFPLGRYWSRGPQTSLYVPAPVLRPGTNDLTVLELHATATRHVQLRDTPDLGATEE